MPRWRVRPNVIALAAFCLAILMVMYMVIDTMNVPFEEQEMNKV